MSITKASLLQLKGRDDFGSFLHELGAHIRTLPNSLDFLPAHERLYKEAIHKREFDFWDRATALLDRVFDAPAPVPTRKNINLHSYAVECINKGDFPALFLAVHPYEANFGSSRSDYWQYYREYHNTGTSGKDFKGRVALLFAQKDFADILCRYSAPVEPQQELKTAYAVAPQSLPEVAEDAQDRLSNAYNAMRKYIGKVKETWEDIKRANEFSSLIVRAEAYYQTVLRTKTSYQYLVDLIKKSFGAKDEDIDAKFEISANNPQSFSRAQERQDYIDQIETDFRKFYDVLHRLEEIFVGGMKEVQTAADVSNADDLRNFKRFVTSFNANDDLDAYDIYAKDMRDAMPIIKAALIYPECQQEFDLFANELESAFRSTPAGFARRLNFKNKLKETAIISRYLETVKRILSW